MERLLYLITAYANQTAIPAEESELQAFVAEESHAAAVQAAMEQYWGALEPEQAWSAEKREAVLGRILQPVVPVRRIGWWRAVAAAVVIGLLALGGWLFLRNDKGIEHKEIAGTSIAPGKAGAKLKLSDGRTILIDSLPDGLIAHDGSVQVYKENGKILYKGGAEQAVIYNEIVTDRGRQWSAELPDGSIAWLNAASSLRYPLQFTGTERLVTMTGEASFRVKHDASQPFRVRVGEMTVEDIGTEFNINAYSNEPVIRTTLIEGSAAVSTGQAKVTVVAGKEASLAGGALTVGEGDTEKAIAWRTGVFNFDGADIHTIARQLERWYNIEVVYEGQLPSYKFGGGTFRNNNLSEVLKVLELAGVHFRLEAGEAGRQGRLVVMK